MKSICLNSAHEAPPILLQADRVRRRIAASDAVASLVAELCFGPPRDASSWAWPTSAPLIVGSAANG